MHKQVTAHVKPKEMIDLLFLSKSYENIYEQLTRISMCPVKDPQNVVLWHSVQSLWFLLCFQLPLLIFFFFFFGGGGGSTLHSLWDLRSPTKCRNWTPVVETRCSNQWTTGEVPKSPLFMRISVMLDQSLP